MYIPSTRNRRFPLWQALLFYAATTAVGFLTSGRQQQSQQFYKKRKQAPWAPPGWVFGPAWSLINIFLTRALFTLIHEEDKSRRDCALLALQAGIWVIFCSFGYVYFRKRSPILAAAWTLTDAGLATASILLAKRRGAAFAANYLPLLIWTYFAGTVAVYQALENSDPLLETPALIF